MTNTSGLTMPLIALSAMLLFLLPLAVAIFAGETVAGEASWGSLRYLLARPVPRWQVFAAKVAVAAAYSVAAVLIAVLVSLATGVIAFGWHPLTVLDLQHTSPFVVASATFKPFAATGPNQRDRACPRGPSSGPAAPWRRRKVRHSGRFRLA